MNDKQPTFLGLVALAVLALIFAEIIHPTPEGIAMRRTLGFTIDQ